MPSVKSSILRVQQALAAKGFNPGVIDGVWGRRTEAAVKAFQAAKGLVPDGVVGPLTSAQLFGGNGHAPQPTTPLDDVGLVWFLEARRLLGTAEVKGNGSNATILDWADGRGIPYKGDDIPWCGLFTAHCVGSTLSSEPLPPNPLGARNWMRFGGPCEPQPGAIMVFWRGKRDGFQGHVGFYAGEDDGAYHVLGGNQSDSVNVARIGRDRFLGARWPATVPLAEGGPVVKEATQSLSVDEG